MSNTIDPQDGNENSLYSGEAYRRKVIASFPLRKQLTITQHLKAADNLDRENAIELLKDTLVQLSQKDVLFADLLKNK